MKIFLATARTDDVAWGAAHGMLDGVLTSPALLAEEARDDARAHLVELCRLVHGPIFASVQAIDAAGAYRDGKELAKLSDQIVAQLPLVEETLGAMRRLRADGVRVAATHVFNTAQALLAVRAGASSVVIALDQLDAAGHDAIGVVRDIRAAFDSSDAVAVSESLCRALLVHPLTDRGVSQFIGDVARLRRVWPVS